MQRLIPTTLIAFLTAFALILAPGCSTTKSVLNRATFGLVGAEEDDKAAASADKTAENDAKAQAEAEKKQRKEQEKAEKQARKEAREREKQTEAEQDEEKGWASTLTFGLIGGKGGEEKAEKQAQEDAKKQEKQARKAEEKAQKEEREAAKKAEKQAKKEAERAEKAAQKEETPEPETAPAEQAPQEETKEERSWASKLTFGLVGGKAAEGEKAAEGDKEASEAAEREQRQAEKAEKEAAKQAKREEKEAKKANKESQKQAKGEEVAVKEAAPADETAKQAAPEATPTQEPKPKRTLMNKLTFGLVGGEKAEEQPAAEAVPEVGAEPSEKDLKKEEKRQAKAVEEAHKERVSALPDEARKLGKLPFTTSVKEEKLWSGETVRVADRESYTEDGYGICDIGDVRIAVKDMTFEGRWHTARIVIDSSEKADLQGSSGTGNRRFTYNYTEGVAKCTFGSISFSIANCKVTIGGVDVPIGTGRQLVVVSPQGEVQGSYPLD